MVYFSTIDLHARWTAVALIFLVLQSIALVAMGQSLICECGRVDLWHPNPAGPETSQHFSDWYSFTHVVHGLGFYLFVFLMAPRMALTAKFAAVVGMESAWELIENTPFIIERYRQSALARGYFGDSVINSIGDTLATGLGFAIAAFLPVRLSVALFVLIELALAYTIRDNLSLNVIQLFHPFEIISTWQRR